MLLYGMIEDRGYVMQQSMEIVYAYARIFVVEDHEAGAPIDIKTRQRQSNRSSSRNKTFTNMILEDLISLKSFYRFTVSPAAPQNKTGRRT